GRLARLDYARDLVVIEWNFGNQNGVGAAGDTAVQCDPSGVAPHHFDNHDPPVTCRSGVHSIERIHHNIDSGIESERRCCRFEIVVDGLRDTDAIDAGLLQLLRRHHRPIAANDDQCSHMKLLQDFLGARNYVRRHNGPIACAHFGDEMTPVGAAEQYHDQSTRIHGYHLALSHNVRLTVRCENYTTPCSRCAAGLDSVNPHCAEKFVRVAEDMIESMPGAIECNLGVLLRDIKPE